MKQRIYIISKLWIIPAIAAGLVFFIVRPMLAQIVERDMIIETFVATENVEIGAETDGWNSQIYYIFDGKKYFISDPSINSYHPHTNGEYIVWEGAILSETHIFLYHLPTKTTTQITERGVNILPRVSRDGKVVWQKWIDNTWQIVFFDGISKLQLTAGDVSMSPDIEGEEIVFSRKDKNGNWRAVKYDVVFKKAAKIKDGLEAKGSKFKWGKVYFPLLADEIEPTTNTEESVAGIILDSDNSSAGTVQQNPVTLEDIINRDFSAEDFPDAVDGPAPKSLEAKCATIYSCMDFCSKNKYYDPCRLLWYNLLMGDFEENTEINNTDAVVNEQSDQPVIEEDLSTSSVAVASSTQEISNPIIVPDDVIDDKDSAYTTSTETLMEAEAIQEEIENLEIETITEEDVLDEIENNIIITEEEDQLIEDIKIAEEVIISSEEIIVPVEPTVINDLLTTSSSTM